MVSNPRIEPLQPGKRSGADPHKNTPASTVAEDLIAAALGIAVVTAVYLDGRAHVLGLPDSFFTLWHSLLYGGLLLLIVWLAVISRRTATRYRLDRPARLPAGYGLAAVGAALFAVSGVLDMVWHQIFGVEFGLDALLSPTHLLLFMGGALLLSGPVRAFRLRALPLSMSGRLAPTLGVLGIAGIAAFALSFLSGFITDSATVAVGHAPEGTDAHNIAEGLASAGLASYVLTSLILVVPLAYLIRFRLAGPGTALIVVTSVAMLAAVLGDFRNMGTVIAALAAGALLDVVLFALRRLSVPLRPQELVLASLLPLLVWPGQLLATNMARSVLWSLEMLTGVVTVAALASFATVFVLGLDSHAVNEPGGTGQEIPSPAE